MKYSVTVLPAQVNIQASAGESLVSALQQAGLVPDAPCGGNGTCGKCKVRIDNQEVLACRTQIDRDLTVTLPGTASPKILTAAPLSQPVSGADGYTLAFDIGTTTLVGFLLDGTSGAELSSAGLTNPQTAFGADVITRIHLATKGQQQALTACIQQALEQLTRTLCHQAQLSPSQIRTVSVVGNPAMQQLFFGISLENLATVPFAPVLTEAKTILAKTILPLWENATLYIVPNISGFVGADTIACVLSTQMHRQDPITLLVDIGTNGEMVLGNQQRMLSCSTAAGPALEGANIHCGMRAQAGAIAHVKLENGQFHCSTIDDAKPIGICGSGLIDAVAAALDAGLLNHRGRIQNADHTIHLTDQISLTQEDLRQLQLAKGAIRAGVELLAQQLGISVAQIERVYLAGAFGTYLDPRSACRIGLLPPQLEDRVIAVGNAAGSGAKLLALDESALPCAQELAQRIEAVELAALPDFAKTFAKQMGFEE